MDNFDLFTIFRKRISQISQISIDNAQDLFFSGSRLRLYKLFDTSTATNFNSLFSLAYFPDWCTDLDRPLIDSSNGTSFKKLYYNAGYGGNSAFRYNEPPRIDTSNGLYFDEAYRQMWCREVTVDTPKGMSFVQMFVASSALTTIHGLDVSNASHNLTNLFTATSKISTINFVGTIPRTIYFKECPLTLECAKDILTRLVNYTGTQNESKYSIAFNEATWNLLNADGEVSPDGTTWENYVMDKGWNI
jgi:hypothetical protein